MEQFRHIGEVLGSLKALMVLRDEIQINQRQCSLIHDIFSLAFDTISDEIKQNLKLEERNTKWKPLEFPLRELCRVFKEGELYIRHCLDSKEWWGKAITLSHNCDCIEFHIHNLLCYFPAVIEAIESIGEVSGLDEDEKEKKKLMLSRKYDMEWNDPKLFQWRFGKQYLVPREICKQLENAWREDNWRLMEALKDKRSSTKVTLTKNDHHLADMLMKKLLNGSEKTGKELMPMSVLLGAKDYQVRRRLGRGKEYKEIVWLGQSFALRYFNGERQDHEAEVSTLMSLSHPNILQYLCGFYDEEKKEFNLVMELMNKDLWTYMKENCGPRRQILFSIPVVVDLMLQIARSIEYLHSKKIYHGDLNPCNILLKARNSQEGYFQAKVAGFGLSSLQNGDAPRSSPTHNPISEELNPIIWYAPEVLAQLEQPGKDSTSSKYSEKSDAYSFGMIFFELLTGKVPFEDNHLQGERTSHNIKAGERPLFPYRSPKYLVSLIKKCWQTDPSQRPSFSSICRILRYTKKFLAMNSEQIINADLNQLEVLSPPVDSCDIETMFLKNFPTERVSNLSAVSQIPYEMFAYKVAEKGKISLSNAQEKIIEQTKVEQSVSNKEENDDDQNMVFGDDKVSIMDDDLFQLAPSPKSDYGDTPSVYSEAPTRKTPFLSGRVSKVSKVNQPSLASIPSRRRTPQVSDSKINKGVSVTTPSIRRRRCEANHVSDSKPSLKLKTRDHSPLARNVTNSNGGIRLTKSRSQSTLTSNLSMSPARVMRRATNTETQLTLQKRVMSGSGARVPSRSDLDKITRGRLAPLALSPLSPYVMRSRRTCGHASDSESGSRSKRESMSPLVMSPYVTRTCGHLSD